MYKAARALFAKFITTQTSHVFAVGFGVFAALSLTLLFTAGCNRKIYEEPTPGPSTSTAVVYTFNKVLKPGFGGKVELIKQSDGTALARVTFTGMREGFVYYGSVMRGSSDADKASIYADLNNCTSGYAETWLFEDVENNKIYYDSLLAGTLYVRVSEIPLSSGQPFDVLQADIGTNALTGNFKEFVIIPTPGNSVTGSITARQRVNGNFQLSAALVGGPSAYMPLSLYKGEPDRPETWQLIKLLTGLTPSGSSLSELVELKGGLAAFDTLTGFFALSFSDDKKDSLVGFVPLGNNRPTGRQETAVLYYSLDSTVNATLTLTEYKSGVWKPSITLPDLPGEALFYLNIQQGAAINHTSAQLPVGLCRQKLADKTTTSWPRLYFNNRLWTGDSLLAGNYNLRLDSDTLRYSATNLPVADIGQNRLLSTEFKRFALANNQHPNYPDFAGFVSIRKRASGTCLIRVDMNNSYSLGSYTINLNGGNYISGTTPSLTEFWQQLSVLPGGQAGLKIYREFEPRNAADAALPYTYFSSGKYIDITDDDSPPVRICAGNIP